MGQPVKPERTTTGFAHQHDGAGDERPAPAALRLSRRQVLRGGLALGGGAMISALLAACGGTAATATTAPRTGATTGAATTGAATTAAGGATTAATAARTTPATAGTPAAATAVRTAATPGAATQAGTPGLGYQARTDVRGEVLFWHFWGSPVRRTAVRRIIGEFNQVYPNIKVNETFVPFGDIWTRNIAAVAAGSGMPDVIVEDRTQLRNRAANKIESSLQDFARRDNISGEQFWKFTWDEAVVDNEVYGLPYETDIRVLYFNKAALADAGLDPEKPPTNWDELWSYAEKIDKKEGNKLERIGFYPLIGNIGLDSWAWCNGGDWQTRDLQPTINRKENVEALAWIKKWADRYGKPNVDAFRGTFGQGNQDEFMSGKVAMKVDIQGYTSFLNFYNPQFQTADKRNLGYGVAAIPPAPGQKPAAFSGGFTLSIPRGAKNREPAWEFIKYMTFVGQRSWARDTFAMPTVENVAKNDPALLAAPNWKFFVDSMSYGRPGVYNPYYPTMLGDLLGPATDDVLVRGKDPQQALDDAQKKAEQEVAKNRR